MRMVFARYAAAWGYLAAVCTAEIVYALLPDRDAAALLAWASTNVHNLTHNPVGSIIASAFFPTGALLAWPVLIALALFGANSVLGNWRTVVTCAAGHVIGTLVSEGILAYRIDDGTVPAAGRFIRDVGPSYVVVTAIAVALVWGRWPARLAAAVDFAVLIFIGGIFSGISHLHVAAVGHAIALLTGCIVGGAFVWRLRSALAAAAPVRDPDLENQEKR